MCVPVDGTIPKCLLKYAKQDFVSSDESGGPGISLGSPVWIDKSNRLCGDVTLKAVGKTLVYPALRTSNMKPFAPYLGEVVEATMTLSGVGFEDKAQLTNDIGKLKAFRESIAAAIAIDGVDSGDIVIIKVCDGTGCIILASSNRRSSSRRATSGISVVYQIQTGGASLEAIQQAMQSDAFISTFQGNLAQSGYAVTATVPNAATTTESATTATNLVEEITEEIPEEPSKRLSNGAIAGVAVGGAVGLGLIGVAAYSLSKTKSADSAPSGSAAALSPLAQSAAATQPAADMVFQKEGTSAQHDAIPQDLEHGRSDDATQMVTT